MDNRAFIPLYLNSKIIENLFTIIIEEFSQSETKSIKEQIALNIDTPLSEIIPGKYIQGDLKLQVSNEFSAQATEERKVKMVSIFINLMKLLKKNKLLKEINCQSSIEGIAPGDFIMFSCELMEDPIISHFKDIQNSNEFLRYISEDEDIEKEKFAGENDFLKSYEKTSYRKLLIKNCISKDINFILGVERDFMETSLDYLFLGPVTVMGKVINIINKEDIYNTDLCSSKFYRYVIKRKGRENLRMKFNYEDNFIINNSVEKFIEVIPISIYF